MIIWHDYVERKRSDTMVRTETKHTKENSRHERTPTLFRHRFVDCAYVYTHDTNKKVAFNSISLWSPALAICFAMLLKIADYVAETWQMVLNI